VIKLANKWLADPITTETGVTVEELDKHERASGRIWPAALREWRRLLGKHSIAMDEDVCECETWLQFIGRDSRWLCLFEEIQEGWYCGILNEHCNLPDPPVHFQSNVVDLVSDWKIDPQRVIEGRFVEVAGSLTDFVRAMLIRYIGFGFGLTGDHVMCARFVPRQFYAYEPQPLIQEFKLQLANDFPAGFQPYINSDETLILIDGWGIAALTRDLFEPMAAIVKREGGELEFTARMGQQSQVEVVWEDEDDGLE
jgi:hypothetical protein